MSPWPFRRRKESNEPPRPSEDTRGELQQAQRALRDAKALDRAAEDLGHRADEVREQWRVTRERNHVAEAVAEIMRRRAQNP